MSNALIIQLVGVLVATACAIPGVFLVLRRAAMVSDALSHSILFGIIIGFLIFNVDTSSPLLILTAAASGLLTVWLVEVLVHTKRLNSDAAIGLVFPVLFSIAVVIINTRLRNVHIDIDSVLLGAIEFAPINKMTLLGVRVPEGLVVMSVILLINVVFVSLLWKELKVSTFDAGLAAAMGFSPSLLYYGLMSVVSVTAVGAFDHVGAILVIALMVAPPATAYLLTDRLEVMLLLAILFGSLSAISGYWVARLLVVNIAGVMASMTGVFFLLALIFAPQRGLLAQQIEAIQRRKRFAIDMLLVHLRSHEGTEQEAHENSVAHLLEHLNWQADFAQSTIRRARQLGYINRGQEQTDFLQLTAKGRQLATQLTAR